MVGADKWRNPEADLPQDFEARRAENYRELRKPLIPRSRSCSKAASKVTRSATGCVRS